MTNRVDKTDKSHCIKYNKHAVLSAYKGTNIRFLTSDNNSEKLWLR